MRLINSKPIHLFKHNIYYFFKQNDVSLSSNFESHNCYSYNYKTDNITCYSNRHIVIMNITYFRLECS